MAASSLVSMPTSKLGLERDCSFVKSPCKSTGLSLPAQPPLLENPRMSTPPQDDMTDLLLSPHGINFHAGAHPSARPGRSLSFLPTDDRIPSIMSVARFRCMCGCTHTV